MQRLLETERTLRQTLDTLESRVQERTADLARANQALQQEIAEHKRTTEALQDREHQLHLIIDNLPAHVAYVGPDQRYHFINGQYAAWLDRTPAEIIGRHMRDILGETPYEYIAPHVDRVLSGTSVVFENHVQSSRNQEWGLVHFVPDRHSNGHVQGFFVLVHDITDIKQAEAVIRHQQEMLFRHEKLASMGALLASVAHELNNPLAIVKMQVDLLAEEAAEHSLHERVRELHHATEQCMRIVHNFLTLARQNPPQHSPVQLNTIIEETLELLAHTLRLDNIVVSTHLADDLPLFEADPAQIHQVIINLLINAQQALRESFPPRQVTITTQVNSAQGRLLLELADTGPGIPAVIQARIFEPFFTTKPLGVGTGMGLSLCQNIVESHGGTIRVTSEPGQGAVFRVELPMGRPVPVTEELDDVEPLPPSTVASAILVVDDERGIRRALAYLLRREGHKVDTAMHGRQALHMLQEQSYDLVLCDLRMPELDGPSLYRQIVASKPQYLQRFVFLTGDTLSPETEAFLEQTPALRLVKPFSAVQGRQTVRQALQTQH
jgi:PAS domain S-box-containing protein